MGRISKAEPLNSTVFYGLQINVLVFLNPYAEDNDLLPKSLYQ